MLKGCFETDSSKGRAGRSCLMQLTFNFVFSIKLNINLKNEIVLDSTEIRPEGHIEITVVRFYKL